MLDTIAIEMLEAIRQQGRSGATVREAMAGVSPNELATDSDKRSAWNDLVRSNAIYTIGYRDQQPVVRARKLTNPVRFATTFKNIFVW